jgi:toxin ParE1/3/4
MAHRVEWSSRALSDLQDIADYISADSPSYAANVIRKILSSTRMLSDFPEAGRALAKDETERFIISERYRILYKVFTNHIVIGAIVHGSRDLPRQ